MAPRPPGDRRAVSVSAALIVRDEERFLPGCLASVAPIVDEVVVVDTGSVDRTVEIARSAGARVFRFDWVDDFAAARNHGLDRCNGDWILYVDADERVAGDRSRLGVLGDPQVLGALVAFRPRVGWSRYRDIRLFRNRPDLRFEGAIHENIWPAISRIRRVEVATIEPVDVEIAHLGYEGDQSAKHERNLPLLQRRLAQDPTHLFSWDHLARTLLALGREAEAVAAWEQAVEVIASRAPDSAQDFLPLGALIHHRLDRGQPVDELLRLGEEKFGDASSVRFTRARAACLAGDHEQVVADLRPLLAAGTDPVDPVSAFDLRLFGDVGWELLANSCFALGRFDEAAAAYDHAHELAPARHLAAKAAASRGRAAAGGSSRR